MELVNFPKKEFPLSLALAQFASKHGVERNLLVDLSLLFWVLFLLLSSVLEGISNGGSNSIPELLVVPPPPPKNLLPDPDLEAPALEKPDRPSSIDLGELIPPPDDEGEAAAVVGKNLV